MLSATANAKYSTYSPLDLCPKVSLRCNAQLSKFLFTNNLAKQSQTVTSTGSGELYDQYTHAKM